VSVVVTGVHDVISIFAMPGCSNTQGIKRNIKMNKALLSIIPATVNIVKLLPVLFLFTGFQAYAAPITTIGNLSYDGTLISGDGRTYLGFDTLASKTYQETLDLTAPGQLYANYRIANTADSEYFIDSLFGDNPERCSNVYGNDEYHPCGNIPGWSDGVFGETYSVDSDLVLFLADRYTEDAGYIHIIDETDKVVQKENAYSFNEADAKTQDNARPSSWLLVANYPTSFSQVSTPSSFAIFVLGLAGIGFARRRLHNQA
jgi:hypothetical protein